MTTEHALRQVAAWFAQDVAANETRIWDYAFPLAFRDLVAHELVSNPDLGWPDLEAAYDFLDEGNYNWADIPEGGTHDTV